MVSLFLQANIQRGDNRHGNLWSHSVVSGRIKSYFAAFSDVCPLCGITTPFRKKERQARVPMRFPYKGIFSFFAFTPSQSHSKF